MPDATTPLLPGPSTSASSDSHPIFLRACHSPWRWINQSVLTLFRFIISAYLLVVLGFSTKYKLEMEDDHTRWRIPFQFSSVAFSSLLMYNLLVTVSLNHKPIGARAKLEVANASYRHGRSCTLYYLRSYPKTLPSAMATSSATDSSTPCYPPSRARYGNHTHPLWFSLFYTVSHVFTFMNTIIYWAVLVPAGHGGFKPPHYPHRHPHAPDNSTVAGYDPHKGLFEEGHLKAFSIINVWSITSVIAVLEILLFNSIRRQTLGKLVTGHAGLFFLDPELMGDVHGAALAASILFVTLAPGIFSYMYGLIAMRESMTAKHETSQ
ncbi:hypothetical protein PG987_007092 [Apiospora arundinis]